MVHGLAALTLACVVYCVHEGYATGSYYNKQCVCSDTYLFEDIIQPRLRLEKKREPKTTSEFYYEDLNDARSDYL